MGVASVRVVGVLSRLKKKAADMAKVDPALWRDIMAYLRQRHAPICRQWFEDLEPIELHNGLLKVHTPNGVQQNYLQRKCLDQFNEAVQASTGALVAVRFVADEAPPAAEPRETVSVGGGNHSAAPGVLAVAPQRSHAAPARATTTAPPVKRTPVTPSRHDEMTRGGEDWESAGESIVISPDYSFENFVTGPANHLAYAASVAVANQPGKAYNPLFIHGGVGLGKTHLLQAICQSIMHRDPHKKILYLSCDSFMNHFLACVQSGKMNEFRNRYRHVDMLVIDDIHFLANKERSQEEFFHTFNALYQSQKQIVLSSDSPPSEIPQLEERLVSRFQWGLVAQVSKPDFETRVAILRAKAKVRGIELPPEVIEYVANKIDSNARELEGALTTIQGHGTLQNKPIDMALAQQALGESNLHPIGSQVTLQSIINAVTAFFNVKLSDLQSKRRHKSVTGPRQVCMWFARKRTRFSLEEIGGYFGGRDHTTVMHSIRIVDERAEQDPAFAAQLAKLEQTIDRAMDGV